jgi:hypothetical protein
VWFPDVEIPRMAPKWSGKRMFTFFIVC